MSNIESILKENRIFAPHFAWQKNAVIHSIEAYHALCQEAESDYQGFWAKQAKEHLVFTKPFHQILDDSNPPFYRWFADGELNVSAHCLDHNIENGLGDKIALIFESDSGEISQITFKEMQHKVCQLANGLKSLGMKTGDKIVIYMPTSIEAIAAMLACARMGMTHSVVFAGFSAKSLHDRIVAVDAVAIITADEQVRGGKRLPLKQLVDDALKQGQCEKVRHVVVYQRTASPIPWTDSRDIFLHDLMKQQSNQCDPVPVNSEHPLFILYTSGSTGKPKGIQHSSAGYLLWAILTMKWTFDIKPDDIFWCTADIGWITGHTYITYGPMAVGATQLIFEGVPTYPSANRFWHMIQKHRVSIFYTAPTAIRSLIKASDADPNTHPKKYDLHSLRILGSVGEPINPEAWIWYYKNVGHEKCPIVDTFWQTESGGHLITPLPAVTNLVPGSCTLPLPGIMAAIVDSKGQDLPKGQGGFLVIKKPWPSMVRTLYNNSELFQQNYFPQHLGGQYYLAGDGAVQNPQNGYFTIMGRLDDVLNISGHRLGTMEIESALVSHHDVAEAAVVGKPDPKTGEAIVAFVVLKKQISNSDEKNSLCQRLQKHVAQMISPIAKPAEIRFGNNLPKTRSGKIMRRLLKELAMNKKIHQDISTLEDSSVLTELTLK